MPLVLATRYVIPETKRHPRKFDLPGTVTGSLGFALLVYGLTHGATGPDGVSHWGDAATLRRAGRCARLARLVPYDQDPDGRATAPAADPPRSQPDRRIRDAALHRRGILRDVLRDAVPPDGVGLQRYPSRLRISALHRDVHHRLGHRLADRSPVRCPDPDDDRRADGGGGAVVALSRGRPQPT